MKRTLYLAVYSEKTPETVLNDEIWFTNNEKPDLPYIEIEAKVKFVEPHFISNRSKFAEKLGVSIIIPKKFA